MERPEFVDYWTHKWSDLLLVSTRKLPQPAESYHESWSSQSAPPKAQPEVPFYPPPVIIAPQNGDTGIPPQDFQHREPGRHSR